MRHLLAFLAALFVALPAVAAPATETVSQAVNLTGHWVGFAALGIFVFAYALVMSEEYLHLKKSKPVIVAAGLIWALIALVLAQMGDTTTAATAVRHYLMEFGELFLFLLAAMTFVNTIEERGVFDALRAWLVTRGWSLRTLFWVTGILTFFLSPIADNMTTALIMGAVVLTLGVGNPRFIGLSCISIVVAANAGGAFSPFGDITTLMVWQKGVVEFHQFFALFMPSAVNWLVPAFIMSFAVPNAQPAPVTEEVKIHKGGLVVVGLFIFTVALAVAAHSLLHLPPVLGMMTGMGLLKFYGYFMKRSYDKRVPINLPDDVFAAPQLRDEQAREKAPFDPFKQLERSEWDTLMFFYGIILCVGGLSTIGYLAMTSEALYGGLGPTNANILIGVLSAPIDNIPAMFAVLAMEPQMSLGQWLLVTLAVGTGGSMLSIGSAAGVALMGQARGYYTFLSHLKWAWAIALGYIASIATHLWLNAGLL